MVPVNDELIPNRLHLIANKCIDPIELFISICTFRKEEAKRDALMNAIAVPTQVARDVNKLWSTLKEVAPVVNIQCISDIQVSHKLESL